jgi:hypothetical protein
MNRLTSVLLAGTAGIAVLSTAGLAAASPASPSGGPAKTHHHPLLTAAQRDTLRTTGHVEVLKHTRKHGDVTLDIQRGTITALTPTSITLMSKDGYRHSYQVVPTTKVRENGKPEDLTALKPTERVMIVALHGADGDTARTISCLRPPATDPSRTPAT